jgi:hypothetical protein
MVSQVGLNTSVAAAMPQAVSTNAQTTTNTGSLFSNYSSTPTNDYSNDIMMQGLNFGQIATALNQAQQQEQPTAQIPAQTTQTEVQQPTQTSFEGQQTEKTQAQTTTEEEPKGSNIAKILGAATGLVAPLVPKAFKLLKGGSFKELFKLKELAVACPIFGVVGLGMGMLLDSCIDSQKTKSQAEQNQNQQQNQTEVIQNFLNGHQS